MQYRELHWRKLIPGVLLVTGLVLTALLVLVRVGLGNLPGRKFTIYALSDQARGILQGSAVWIAGQQAGVVSDVHFLEMPPAIPGAVDPGTPRILLELAVLEELHHLIGRNSYAQIRAGSRFLGNPVVHVSLGSVSDAVIREGDTIVARPQFDAEAVVAKAEAAMALFPIVKRDLETVMASASILDSLLALVMPSGNVNRGKSPLLELVASMGQLAQRLDSGSMGLFMHDSALAVRMKSVSSSTDSLSRLYDIEQSALGRFVRDTALFAKIDSLADRFGSVLATLNTRYNLKSGTRAQALRVEIDRLNASLKALRNDARRHPFRYIVF